MDPDLERRFARVRRQDAAMRNAAAKFACAARRCADILTAFGIAYRDAHEKWRAAIREFNDDMLERRGKRE